MATFSELYGDLLTRELGTDDSTQLFTTSRRKAAVNEGIQQFADLTECFIRRSTIAISGGTGEYDLTSTAVMGSSDFVRLTRNEDVEFRYAYGTSTTVAVLAGPDLQRTDIGWMNAYEPGWQVSSVASSVEQLPTRYYERDDGPAHYLGFHPVPSTGSSATATARVSYVARPEPLTSDTQEPFSLGAEGKGELRPYHQASVHYAASQLEKLRRDTEASGRQMQLFLGWVTRFITSRAGRKKRAHVTPARRYFRSVGSE